MDAVSLIIILRALFIFSLLQQGWSVRKCKNSNNIHLFKSIKKNNS
jgi:hypothetical protein